MRSRAAVAKTTGVSSRTVASRLSTAVVPEAAAKTIASSRRGRPRAPLAIAAPSASNSPATRQPSASTSSAARNASVGPRSPAASRASSGLSTPDATSATAPAAATAQSGAKRGRATAAPSVASSARSAAASLIARGPAGAPRHDDHPRGDRRAARRGGGPPPDSAGRRLEIRRDGRRAQPHRAPHALGQEPVPAAEQLHRGGHEDGADDRRVEQDRRRQAEPELPQRREAAGDE